MADESRPDPDPTLYRQIQQELTSLRELIEARLDGMDRATELLSANVNRVPSDTDKQISHLKELHGERFHSIQKQFDERDVRSQASEDAAKVAVNAALQAQKEAAGAQNESNAAAITKSEASTIKQIDGILALLTSNTTGINDKFSAINARLDRGDGAVRATSDVHTEQRLNIGTVLGIVMGVIGIAGFVFAVTHSAPPAPIVVQAPVGRAP